MLLGGVMMMMTAITPSLLQAQAAAAASPRGALEVAFTYNATLADAVTGNSFWMQGVGAQIHGQFLGGLGMVADIAGAHQSNINSSGVGLDLVTATFGPRYTWTRPHQRYGLYAQALAGTAIGFNGIFPAPRGANTTSLGLAVKAGGGLNLTLSPHVVLRAFEADYLRTQLPNSTTNVQNNITLGAGIALRFH
jgi:hypothetical protein